MTKALTLLFADVVDSTGIASAIGDERMAEISSLHDGVARELLRGWHGREIDKSDGMLVVFEEVSSAVQWALAYNRRLKELDIPFKARLGIHRGPVSTRANDPRDVALGAKPLEVEGLAKSVAARIMGLARGGQTLLSSDAFRSLDGDLARTRSHGHWRMKGLVEPVEVFEVVDSGQGFSPPEDCAKSYRVVRKGDIWVPSKSIKHNLPSERGSFVGRDDAVQALVTALTDHRQITLVGAGGVGKTRLATHFARAWLGEFPGGVAFCDLSQARNLDGVLLAVSQSLEVALGKSDLATQLANAMTRRGDCLIILDNFEQVTAAARATVAQWLNKTERARFLVTSREVLGIAGERVLSLSTLSAAAGFALFVDRAKAAKSDFDFDVEGSQAISRLVKLLDYLPLAIELASARVRLLEPMALLKKMHERFKLLSYGTGRLDRQSTLRATLDWSWDLLSQVEQAALSQLSVFMGGFTLEAAEAILEFPEEEAPPWSLDVMQSLIDKSLLNRRGAERFEMLESVREYAGERLQPIARIEAERRHGAFYCQTSDTPAEGTGGFELENLVAACTRAVGRGDSAIAVPALVLAWRALKLKGPFRVGVELGEAVSMLTTLSPTQAAIVRRVLGNALQACGATGRARTVLEEALALAASSKDAELVCLALDRLAESHAFEGDMVGALQLYERALDGLDAASDPALECAILSGMGTCEAYLGQVERAGHLYRTALAKARQARARRWEGGALGNLGQWNANQGRKVDALQHYQSALAIACELNDRPWEGNVRCNLGLLHLGLDNNSEAQRELEIALAVARELGYQRLESVVLCNLGLSLQAQAQPEAARRHFQLAIDLAASLSDRRSEGQFLGYLGYLLGMQGESGEARPRFSRGADLLRGVGDKASLGLLIAQHAQVEQLAGDHAEAAALLGAAERLAAEAGPLPDSEFGLALDLARSRLQVPMTPARSSGT